MIKLFFRLSLILSVYSISIASSYGQSKDKQYKSLLWEISGNGLTKPSYLYGTMHVSKKLVFNLADSFFVCLKNADAVALESSPEVWLDGMEKDKSLYMYSRTYGYMTSEKQFYQRAFEFSIPTNSKFKQLLNSDLSLMNFLLYRSSNSTSTNYEEDTYLDFFLYQSGKRLGKKVYSLEDYEESRILSEKALWPSREKKKKKEKYYYGYNNHEKFENAYRKGDLNALDSIMRLSNTNENHYKYLLYARNEIMVRSMDSLMKEGSLFSGVGAAHLPGENGMIEMLRKKGYTVKPLTFNTIKESEIKGTIENMKMPVSFSKKYAPDSTFSVETPNKLYQLDASNESYLYVSPDLANGCFYMIKSTPHYGLLANESPNYILKRIDSLIYENIQGDILERKNIKLKNGYEGIEITNKTRRGDIHKCQIIVTPTEIIQLLVHGNRTYINETDQDEQFLNSFEFNSNKEYSIKLFCSPNNGYSIKLPASYSFNRETPYGYSMFSETLTALDAKKENVFLVKKRILHDYNYIESDTFELNILCENIIQSAKCSLQNRKLTTHQGYPAIEFSAKNNYVYFHGKIVLRGDEYYLIAQYGKNKNPESVFFKSFALQPYQYKYSTSPYEDKELFYKVSSIEKPVEFKTGYLFQGYNHIFKDRQYENFYSSVMEKAIICPETGEQVNITFSKFHKYYFKKHLDTLWKHRVEIMGKDRSLVNKNFTVNKAEKYASATATFSDTGSVKIIKTKMILKNGALYTLTYLTDSLTPESRFVQEVIKSFTPADTIFENNLFDNKRAKLISDIFSKDSTIAENALRSVDYCSSYFEEGDSKLLFETFNNKGFDKFSTRDKINLIECTSKMKDTILLKPLKKIYLANDDSASVQIAILTILATQKTTASYVLLGELLSLNAPIINDNYLTSHLFEQLSDSLALTITILDDLLLLSGIHEYDYHITHLLAKLNNANNTLSNEAYLKIKRSFINKASIEIKRQRASKNSSSNYISNSADDYKDKIFDYLNFPLAESISDFNLKFGNDLYDYLSILIRNYNEPEIKAIVDKALLINDAVLQLSLNALLLKHKLPANDTIWNFYAKKDNYRLLVYAELKQIGQLSKYPSNYSSQEYFCRAVAYAGKEDFKDSITFYKKYKVLSPKGVKGYAYAFKHIDSDGDIKVDMVTIQHLDEKKIKDDDIDYFTSKTIDKSKKEKDELDKKIRNMLYQYRVVKRDRAPEFSYELYSEKEE